jgi:hypothetical protein
MVDDYRRLRDREGWDWGGDWRIDPQAAWETLPCRLPVPLARLLSGSRSSRT